MIFRRSSLWTATACFVSQETVGQKTLIRDTPWGTSMRGFTPQHSRLNSFLILEPVFYGYFFGQTRTYSD